MKLRIKNKLSTSLMWTVIMFGGGEGGRSLQPFSSLATLILKFGSEVLFTRKNKFSSPFDQERDILDLIS